MTQWSATVLVKKKLNILISNIDNVYRIDCKNMLPTSDAMLSSLKSARCTSLFGIFTFVLEPCSEELSSVYLSFFFLAAYT